MSFYDTYGGSYVRYTEEFVRKHYDKMKRNNYLIDDSVGIYKNPGQAPNDVIDYVGFTLSPYEKREILKYERVYCWPSHGSNLGQTEFEGLHKQLIKRTTGSHIDYRYAIMDRLGRKVFSADDRHLGKQVAIKLVQEGSYSAGVFEELEMLLYLKKMDPDNVQNIVRIWDYGHFRGEQYIVMNRYDTDLKNFMNEFYPKGIPLPMIAEMGRSILEAMVFLKQHRLIHGDIQPSNVLLDHGRVYKLKLTDFKQSFKWKPDYKRGNTGLHYRSPEAFCVNDKPTTAIDMWAFGCLIGEMVNNEIFLKGEHEDDQFYLILEVLNVPPHEFLDNHSRHPYFFPDRISAIKINEPRYCSRNEKGEWVFDYMYGRIPAHRKHPGGSPLKKRFSKDEEKTLNNFITRTLRWIPEKRLTPEHVLNIAFFAEPTPTPTPAPSPEPTTSKPEEPACSQKQVS